jgi:glyoxylase-like metal-dependent hydrolase (beta-lactamase superfamily II)
LNRIEVKSLYDELTATVTYLVFDAVSRDAVVIDPVLDYDQAASIYSFENLDRLEKLIHQEKVKPLFCFETHAHADHLTGAQELKKRFPEIKIAIGARIQEVQTKFKIFLNLGPEFKTDGGQFDVLVKPQETLRVGSLSVRAISTPGHTPACMSFLIGDALFTGDCLFMPDTGTGRCDFPGGSSRDLYFSVFENLYKLPDSIRVFSGHDYKGGGTRPPAWESTLGEQKQKNIHITSQTTLDQYQRLRDARDKNLPAPKLLLPSIQINLACGHIPKPESNGKSYLKIPISKK